MVVAVIIRQRTHTNVAPGTNARTSVVIDPTLTGGGEVPQGAALCWKPGQVLYLHLSGGSSDQALLSKPLYILQRVLECATDSLKGLDLGPQLTALAQIGLQVGLPPWLLLQRRVIFSNYASLRAPLWLLLH